VKQVLERILVVVMLCSAGSSSAGAAKIHTKGEALATVSITPASVTAAPGATGSFAVSIASGDKPVGAYDLVLTWTPGVFMVDNVGAGSSPEFGAPIANVDNNSGQLAIADFQFASLVAPTGSFTIATINYTAGASGGTAIGLTVEELVDTNGSPFTPTSAGGDFTVLGGPTPSATPSDTVAPTPTSTEQATPTSTSQASATPTLAAQTIPTAVDPGHDLNGDGNVGPQDLLILLQGGVLPNELLLLAVDWERPVGDI
jgi:hypothetical protein